MTTADSERTIHRERTAITRHACSQPVRLALRDAIIRRGLSFFDYGCGRGKDVSFLADRGVVASGYDPCFFPSTPKTTAHVVNLGYVINVIENPAERIAVLKEACALARLCLIVAARTKAAAISGANACNDGYVTKRATFQKYYRQQELRDLLHKVLNIIPYPAGAGIFYVFKDDKARNAYLALRYNSAQLFSDGNINRLKRAIKQAPVGKKLPDSLYVHTAAIPYLPLSLQALVAHGRAVVSEIEGDIIVKISKQATSVSFLRYRNFDTDPHPELLLSTKVDLRSGQSSTRDYRKSDNPPILHRKETFVNKDYPHYAEFCRITAREEKLGLLNRNDIGFRKSWQKALAVSDQSTSA